MTTPNVSAAEVIELAARTVRESKDNVDDLTPLLAWARGHASASVRALADRADIAIAAVVERQRREKDIVAAERRVKEAEKRLAAERSKLQTIKSGKAARAARLTDAAREEGRRAREWAVAEGIDVPDRGRVSGQIIARYREATTTRP